MHRRRRIDEPFTQHLEAEGLEFLQFTFRLSPLRTLESEIILYMRPDLLPCRRHFHQPAFYLLLLAICCFSEAVLFMDHLLVELR